MLLVPVKPLLSALPAGGVASLGKLFKGRQFIPVEPAMPVGTFDMDGGLGRTVCTGREIEFPRHFDLRALALWNGYCAGRSLVGVSLVELFLQKRWVFYNGFEPIIHFRQPPVFLYIGSSPLNLGYRPLQVV
jgi:hypothetical protein